ncbi:MAG: hypothetical protein Q8O89_06895 [Nanoarchaeota archaeon]|nr:hypothetical protein [Nanoarchaeota archaeon]
MQNLGAYALGIIKQIDSGEVIPMSDEYFKENIYGNEGLFEKGKQLLKDNFSKRECDEARGGGLGPLNLEELCKDVPEVIAVAEKFKKNSVGLPRVFEYNANMYLEIFAALPNEMKAPYMARVLVKNAEKATDKSVPSECRGVDDFREVYAVCFALWDTNMKL